MFINIILYNTNMVLPILRAWNMLIKKYDIISNIDMWRWFSTMSFLIISISVSQDGFWYTLLDVQNIPKLANSGEKDHYIQFPTSDSNNFASNFADLPAPFFDP